MAATFYTWNLLASDPVTGSVPNPGPFVPQALLGGADPRKSQFERGIKFANVPGGQAKFVVHGGARVFHVNSVLNILSGPPVIHPGDNDSGNGGGHSTDPDRGGHGRGYSGAIKFRYRDYRKAPIPSSINGFEIRNTDLYGNSILNGVGLAPVSANMGHLVSANTVALWRFDEPLSSSNAYDGVNGNTLYQFGNPMPVVGQVSGARQVNSGDYFQAVGNSTFGSTFQGEFSYETWIKPANGSSVSGTLLAYNGVNYKTDSNHRMLIDVFITPSRSIGIHHWSSTSSYATLISSGSITRDVWSHVAVVKTQPSASLAHYAVYFNGVLNTDFGNIISSVSFVSGSGHLLGMGNLVTSFSTGSTTFSGSIDDTRISNVALSSSDVLISYNRGIGRY